MVLDDLRDAADLDGLWPAGPAGRVLITAADAAAVPGEPRVRVLAVPAFSTREALGYLSGRLTTDPDQRSGAIDLAGELGGEPAALAQAGAVIVSSGIRCREYRDYFAQRRAQLARPAAGRCPRRRSPGRCRRSTPGSWRPAGAPGRCWCWPRCWAATAIPGTVFTAPAACQYLTARAPRRRPDPQRAWSAVLALERAGLLAIDAAATPPAVWVSPALQAAVRAAAPPELLDRAVRAAADALARGVARRISRDRGWPRPCGHAPPACGRPPVMRCGPAAAATGCCWRPGTAWTPPGWPARRSPGGGSWPPAASGSSAQATRTRSWRAACWPARCWRPGRRPRP